MHLLSQTKHGIDSLASLTQNELDKIEQVTEMNVEYERALKELAEVTLAAEHMLARPVRVATLEQLGEEMQKHRKFFVNLSHCRGMNIFIFEIKLF